MLSPRNVHGLFVLFEEAFAEWNRDHAPLLAAGLAYYGILSLSPFFILLFLIAGTLLGRDVVESEIMEQIGLLLSPDIAQVFNELLQRAGEGAYSFKITFFAVLLLLFGATGMFVQTTGALNLILGARAGKSGIVRAAARSYLRSFLLLWAIGLILLASSLVTAVVLPVAERLELLLPLRFGLIQLINFLISFILITMLFAATYRALSAVELLWRDLFLGSAVTSLLFVTGDLVLGIYVRTGTIGSLYGAASYLIVLLIWSYYSAQIFFFGAELIKVQRRMHEKERHVLINA